MNWRFWTWGRSAEPPAKPIPDCRSRCDNWQPGDMAVCVVDGPYWGEIVHPIKGRAYKVVEVSEGVGSHKKTGKQVRSYFLRLDGLPHTWCAYAFRKITPEADSTERDESVEFDFRDHLRTPEKAQ